MKRPIPTLVLTLVLLAGAAPPAQAGTYKAIQCYERSGAGHADAAYDSSSQHYRQSADCEGRGLGIEHRADSSRTGSGRYGAWTIAASDGTEILRAALRVDAESENWHVPQVHVGLEGGARELLDGVRGDLHTIDWEGSGGSHLSGRLVCANRRDCGDGENAYLYMRRIALTLRDSTPPAVQLGGTLLEPGSRRGDQVLEVNASDSGSGVRSLTVSLNGQPLESRTLDCHVRDDVAIRVRPCPSAPTPRFEIDTTGADFRQGPNTLTVCASDFSPEATANRSCETRTVRVDNACPVSGRPGTVLRTRFEGEGTRMTAPGDTRAVVVGSLGNSHGDPVAGAEVCVATRVALAQDAPAERIIATPTTKPDGSFRVELPAGPSREVRVAHWRGPQEVVERFLELRSRAVPRLALRPSRGVENGDAVRFDVRIPGPAQANRRVAIQARGTGRWIRIAGGRTDRRGRWSGRYRFRSTTATRRYAFRATVRRQPGYPYLPGKSKTRTLVVTGP
jgi:hypothetical protein